MSILSPLNQQLQQRIQRDRLTIQRNRLLANQAMNPLHPNKSDDEYEELRRVYYPVKECIQKFFINFCSDNDCSLVNPKVFQEMIRVGVWPKNATGAVFDSNQYLQDLCEYVFHLDYPADYTQMQLFIKEVIMGRLEFLCRYPMPETGLTIFDIIRPISQSILQQKNLVIPPVYGAGCVAYPLP